MKTPLGQLYDAWTLAGPWPRFHETEKWKLQRNWPALFFAIERLVAEVENTESFNKDAMLDCLLSNKCDALTAADLVVWGTKRYDEGREAEKRRIKDLKSKHKGPI